MTCIKDWMSFRKKEKYDSENKNMQTTTTDQANCYLESNTNGFFVFDCETVSDDVHY